MGKLRELRYDEVITRLRSFGFRFYRHGKGSHELWVRDIDFQKLNFTRKQGGDHTFRISPTDDAVKFDFWKSIVWI
jgi:hypothetical protein